MTPAQTQAAFARMAYAFCAGVSVFVIITIARVWGL